MRARRYSFAIVVCTGALASLHFCCRNTMAPPSGAGPVARTKGSPPTTAEIPQAGPAARSVGIGLAASTAPDASRSAAAGDASATRQAIDVESARSALLRFAMASDDQVVKSAIPDFGSGPDFDANGFFFMQWYVASGGLDADGPSWSLDIPAKAPGQTYVAWRCVYSGHFFKDGNGQWVARLEYQGRSARGGR